MLQRGAYHLEAYCLGVYESSNPISRLDLQAFEFAAFYIMFTMYLNVNPRVDPCVNPFVIIVDWLYIGFVKLIVKAFGVFLES